MKRIGIVFLLIFISLNVIFTQNLVLPKIFSDNMVLQREVAIPFWGWGDPGKTVKIKLQNQSVSATIDADGKWKAFLPAFKTGGPYVLKFVSGEEVIECQNVMIGDVWFASGQSNMAWVVQKAKNAEEEIKNADYSGIRLFTVPRELHALPREDLNKGSWEICSPTSIPEFSAVAYFFGRELHREYNVPVGLINASWGGTPAEAWTSYDMLRTIEDFQSPVNDLCDKKPDYDSINEINKKHREIRDSLTKQPGNGIMLGVHKPDFEIDTWQQACFPFNWINAGCDDFKGFVWFKKDFCLNENPGQKDYIVKLGKIHGKHEIYLNGEKISEVDESVDFTEITIESGAFKKGINNLAICLLKLRNRGPAFSHEPFALLSQDGDTIAMLSENWYMNCEIEQDFPDLYRTAGNPAAIYNQMVHPVIPFAIKGFIWYQGEANAGKAYQYRELFPALITDWRIRWQQGYLPFLYVQLANFLQVDKQPTMDPWPELREAQLMTLRLPNTAMASAIDLGEEKDIHPKNKQDVGKRLALAAKALAYGGKLEYSGPVYKSYEIEGNKIEISFTHTGSGLTVKNDDRLKGFAIAGKDKKFVWAEAEIKGDKVVVWSEKIKNPVAVRYAWSNNPVCNLYNKENLPASPFRTDQWPGITKKK